MSITWEDALQKYRDQNFQVFTRDNLLSTSLSTITQDLFVPSPTLSFLQNLSDSHRSLWEAFLRGIQNVYRDRQEKDIFLPLKLLLDRATQVAVLYGEHLSWKSPDKWSYLFEVSDLFERNTKQYIIAHAPATLEQIHQAETVIGMSLPRSYVRFLQCTNGLGITPQERQFICGVGNARAIWNEVISFQPFTFSMSEYHEISSYWLQWQDVLAYERERDHETGITTFLSDEHLCIPFAYTIDDWCFDHSQRDEGDEYPIVFWDHEIRQATQEYHDFGAWFSDVVVNRQ